MPKKKQISFAFIKIDSAQYRLYFSKKKSQLSFSEIEQN